MTKKTIGIGIISVIVLVVTVTFFFSEDYLTLPRKAADISIIYPFDGTLFPPEIFPPTFRWTDETPGVTVWKVSFDFEGDGESIEVFPGTTEWRPDREMWETIKHRSLEKKAAVTISGLKRVRSKRPLSSGAISISTSRDEVGAPIFYRDVPLPFIYAVNHKDEIKWRLGNVSSDKPPHVVLEHMPVCGNCHSFSADGRILGMDIDYANDKGSYVISDVQQEIILSKDKVITWSAYKRDERNPTFGLLSQISPDGNFAVSTVKDRSVFVAKDDPYCSQLFFPLKGILAVYYRETGDFRALPGADDPVYVQSNPSWSPDGKHIVFARSKAAELKSIKDRYNVLLSQEECEEFINREKLFLFDLYRIPFNGGKGGKPEPIEGASHNGMSNYFAKYSPDGKWIVFNKASSFMLLQPDSDLYIMPAGGGEPRRMHCNTNRMNSWHSWSPNGRWLVFSSKAFTPYTQLFLTHIDEDGNDTPPVLLSTFTEPDRAANIPEFVNIPPDGIVRIQQRYVDEYSFYREADSFLDFGEYELAEEAFQQALKMDPDNSESWSRMGSMYIRTGNYDKALESLETALKLNPKNVNASFNLSGILVARGNYDRAEKLLQEALKNDPDNASVYSNLGLLYFRKGNISEAEKYFRTALKLDYENTYAHRNLGTILMKKGKIDDAEIHFRKALDIEPRSSVGHYNLGRIYAVKKDYANAEREFRTALDLEPKNPALYFALGEVLSNNKAAVQEAIELIKRGLVLNPNDFGGHILLANLYLGAGTIPLALDEFEMALRINPRAPGLREKIEELKRLVRGG